MNQTFQSARITNLDSVRQYAFWNETKKKTAGNNHVIASRDRERNNENSCRTSWSKTADQQINERYVNFHPEFVTRFAGILRTAYLYCPTILLTQAELFDGIFFQAFGPQIVNDILGKSYKDSPPILVTGTCATLEEGLCSFTIKRRREIDATASHPELYTLDPKVYSVFGRASLSRVQALNEYPIDCCQKLTDGLKEAENGDGSKAQVISHAFEWLVDRERSKNSNSCAFLSCAFLGQRWQEWIDAEREGLVRYQPQKPQAVACNESSHNGTDQSQQIRREFERIFRGLVDGKDQSSGYFEILKQHLKHEDNGQTNLENFLEVLKKIKDMPKRSDAYITIDDAVKSKIIQAEKNCQSQSNKEKGPVRLPLTDKTLRDWYDFVYQRTMAAQHQTYLVSVSTPKNSFERAARAKDKQSSLVLDGNITKILEKMPHTEFTTACYQYRTIIAKWRACTNSTSWFKQQLHTRNMAYSIELASEEHDLVVDAKKVALGFVIALIVALVTALSDNVWFNGNSLPLWVVVLVAWFINLTPDLIDVFSWLRGVHASIKTVVYIA